MIKLTTMQIRGNRYIKNNPLPRFQNIKRNSDIAVKEDMKEQDVKLLGFETEPRFLPYLMQDSYTRERESVSLNAIVMENDKLKAVFLPEYGGRLYSLYSKELHRELLYKNPVLQPANLAIRNAWIAGGIEWNMGQLGHSFTTCEPLFCTVLKDKDGNEFLRMFEYERCHNLFWHIDFHLKPGSETLNAYVRMVNDREVETSAYFWTNIAICEDDKTRVYSGTDEVIYLDMAEKRYGTGRLPFLPHLPEIDASYPSRFGFANEYFFQTPEGDKAPWEAAVYEDNYIFFEKSSDLLRYRKMFCWGNHQGGRRWRDYLSDKGEGSYVEIQAGLSKTQQHGHVFLPGTEIEFVQCFGGIDMDTSVFYEKEWTDGEELLREVLQNTVSDSYVEELLQELKAYKELEPQELLWMGSGYGALETQRRKKEKECEIPKGLLFEQSSMGHEQQPWLKLLQNGVFPEDEKLFPDSYMNQFAWRRLLEESVYSEQGKNSSAYLQLGVMLTEEGNYKKAQEMFENSIQYKETILAYRNLAFIKIKEGKIEEAEQYYDKGITLHRDSDIIWVYMEYLKFLNENNKHKKVWKIYEGLSKDCQNEERIYLQAVYAALYMENLDFVREAFDKEYVYIRENETSLSDIWIAYQKKLHKGTDRDSSIEQVPYELDFRTIPS